MGQHEDLAGLILVSPFTSIQKLIRYHLGSLAHLVTERFPSKELMPKITAPTMIVHGKKDTLIPQAHGEELFELLATQKMIITPAEMSHNESLFTDASWFAQPMHHFFALPDFTFQDIELPTWVQSRNLLSSQQACREASVSWSR